MIIFDFLNNFEREQYFCIIDNEINQNQITMNPFTRIFKSRQKTYEILEQLRLQINEMSKYIVGNEKLESQTNELANNIDVKHNTDLHEESRQVDGFELRDNNDKPLIKFNNVLESDVKGNMHEIFSNKTNQENIKGLLSSVLGGGVNVGLASSAVYGLYEATANPETLMHLSSGGLSSAVIENGKIVSHAGFVQQGVTVFTPMIIFQLTSIVTGQYYMNNINKQLNFANEKLNELVEMFHIERKAMLEKAIFFIKENLAKQTFVLEDFLLMKSMLMEIAGIREEYFLMLNDSIGRIQENNKKKTILASKEAKKLVADFAASGFIDKMKISLIAENLYHLAEVTELHMNICYKDYDINRIELIKQKIEKFKAIKSPSDILFSRTTQLYDTIKDGTLRMLECSKDRSMLSKKEVSELLSDLVKKFDSFEEERTEMLNSILSRYQNILKPFEKEMHILIDNRDGNPKLCVLGD